MPKKSKKKSGVPTPNNASPEPKSAVGFGSSILKKVQNKLVYQKFNEIRRPNEPFYCV